MCLAGVVTPSEPLPQLWDVAGEQRHAFGQVAAKPRVFRFASQNGPVKYRFGPRVLLVAWKLRSLLRSCHTSLREVVKLAFTLCFTGAELQRNLGLVDDGSTPIPERDALRRTAFRLNYMDMLWQRQLHQTASFQRWLYLDASPQGGYNFLVLVEDRVEHRLGMSVHERRSADLGASFRTRHLPVTCLGYGAADKFYNTMNLHHCVSLETGSWTACCKFRSEVYGWTTDQGIESHLGDVPCLFPKDFHGWQSILGDADVARVRWNSAEAAQAFLWPKALGMPDHLHMYFNSLQEAVESQAEWAELEGPYASLALLMRHRDLRGRFLATCVPKGHSDWALVETWNISDKFDWK